MRIQRQIFLFVTLLFAGVGAVGGGVAWFLEIGSVRHAFETEARSLAISVGEFVRPGDIAQVRASGGFRATPLDAVWTRLQRWHLIRRLYLVDAATGAILADTAGAKEGAPSTGALPLAAEEIRPLPYRQESSGEFRLPLLTPASGGGAAIGLEVSADDYFARRREITAGVEAVALWAIGAGAVVGWLLGRFVSRPIRRLSGSMEALGGSQFEDLQNDSSIREVADLSATLAVMHSVLGKTVDKARRALAESDHFRTESGLAAVWRKELQPAAAWTGGGAEAAWASTGGSDPGAATLLAGAHFWGEGSGAAFAGRAVRRSGAGDLDSAIRSRAAASFLGDALQRLPLAAAAEQTRELFGLEDLTAVRWDGSKLERWSDGASETVAWTVGTPLTLACLGPTNRRRLDLFLREFPGHETRRLVAELPALLDSREPGIWLVLRRREAERFGASARPTGR